jgi:4-hydroxyphenylpyruvate dioxygenase
MAAVYKPSVATMSLGRAGSHNLEKKLQISADEGFRGIELYWDDFHSLTLETRGEASNEAYINTARHVADICNDLGLEIISLQPFRNFEGTLDPVKRNEAIEEFKIWLDVAQHLQTDTIGVPSTIVADGHTGDTDVLVRDLKEIALLASERTPPVKIAYENLCFGAYVKTWQEAYDIVEKVNMPNFGFLPDTFNIACSAWADPTSLNGRLPKANDVLRASMSDFRRRVRREKLFLLQVADGERLAAPLLADHPFHVDGQTPRMSYSRNARCFPLEPQGYLPVAAVLSAVLDVGYTGWVSMEVFSHTTQNDDEHCVASHAERAWFSWGMLCLELYLREDDGEDGEDDSDDEVATLASRLSEAETEVDSSGEGDFFRKDDNDDDDDDDDDLD